MPVPEAVAPDTVAVTVSLPLPLDGAVYVTLATPEGLVVADDTLNEPAGLVSRAKLTFTPETGLPFASVTVAETF